MSLWFPKTQRKNLSQAFPFYCVFYCSWLSKKKKIYIYIYKYIMLNNMISSQLSQLILTSSYLEQKHSTITALHQLTPF